MVEVFFALKTLFTLMVIVFFARIALVIGLGQYYYTIFVRRYQNKREMDTNQEIKFDDIDDKEFEKTSKKFK